MEVRKGYKQTEVGVIPEDWEPRPLRTVCKLINGRGFKPFEWEKTGLPIIRIQNLNGSDDFNYFRGIYDKKLEVEPGQLLFAWSGSRGTSFGPHIWFGPLGLLNYHTWKVQIQDSEIHKGFFLHALKQLTTFIEGQAHGASALVHVQKWEMEGFQFPLPPTKAEQEAIAEALSDADALIESLTQLIAKKRQIKQGAMQELLTGKRRLPGFAPANCGYKQTEVGVIPEDWEVIQLGETIGSLEAGVSVNSDEKEKDKFGYEASVLKTSCVYKGTFFPDEAKKIIPRDIRRAKLNPQRDTIIFSRMNTPILVGECGYVGNDFPNLFLPDRLWMTRVGGTKPVNVRWLAYLLSFNLSTGQNRINVMVR